MMTAAQLRQRAACRAMADDAFAGLSFEETCAAIIEHLRLRADAAINDTGGTDVTVPGLEGEVEIAIPHGTESGHVFRLEKKGIKRLDGSGKGDQLVRVEVIIPKSLNKEQKQLLRDFESSLGEKHAEGHKNLMEKVKEMFK